MNNDLMMAVLAMNAYDTKIDQIGITVTVHLIILFDPRAFGPEWGWLKIFFRNASAMNLVDCSFYVAS